MPGEIWSKSGPETDQILADMFNEMFEFHCDIKSLHTSIFHMINKPNKPFTYENMRPIQLLNSIRKLYSIIICERIYDKVHKRLVDRHYGFLRGRGREMQLWMYKFREPVNKRYKFETDVMALDLRHALTR